MWLEEGVSDTEIGDRLQARVPDFPLRPDPGGYWNWLLGALAFMIASTVLLLLGKNAVQHKGIHSAFTDLPEPAKGESDEEKEHWQDRLDDELLDSSL